MAKAFYGWTRDLHLYIGLFLSPFLLVFAVSVFFLNHARAPVPGPPPATAQVRSIRVPAGIEAAQGPERVQLAGEVLSQLGISGEINFIRTVQKENRLVIAVVKPGVEGVVDLRVKEGTATVSQRRTTFWESLSYLHRMPGPHNAAIRGNWFWTRAWQWLADATVYLSVFLSLSGIYLWAVLRAERKVGLILMLAGALTFAGIVYAVIA
jgi:hypothetical protein